VLDADDPSSAAQNEGRERGNSRDDPTHSNPPFAKVRLVSRRPTRLA